VRPKLIIVKTYVNAMFKYVKHEREIMIRRGKTLKSALIIISLFLIIFTLQPIKLDPKLKAVLSTILILAVTLVMENI